MKIGAIKILISNCNTGIYLRWFYNGWHYFNFTNGYTIQMRTESMDTQVTRFFSRISKIERPTRLKAEYSYQITLEGIAPKDVGGFLGLLLAEKVEEWGGNRIGSVTADSTLITVDTTFITADTFIIPGIWREVEITRGDHPIRDAGAEGYYLDFEITRKELPVTSAVYQKSLKLYLGDTLCDMDDDEVVPINKQVNDIAEMQDRQSDFTAQFKIRKTRAMRALFELSGEVGASTTFPYQNQYCKLIQDNIEAITNGIMILDKTDDQYYYVSIISGNKSFFSSIEKLKLVDITLMMPGHECDHTWNVATMKDTQLHDFDYVYPLCEPSDDGGIDPLTDDGDTVEMYGGWIWPFIKIKTIWDEIFTNAGYYCDGKILTDKIFERLFMPVCNLKMNPVHITANLANGSHIGMIDHININSNLPAPNIIISGDPYFRATGIYITPYTATYGFKVRLSLVSDWAPNDNITTYVFSNNIQKVALTLNSDLTVPMGIGQNLEYTYTGEYQATALEYLTIRITDAYNLVHVYYSVTYIDITKIGYNNPVTPHLNLPDISQSEFVKLVCNLFGLIPDVTARDKRIKFWNYDELYDNISKARDWSTYLSERDDETEFKFGDYAQNNYLKYKDSDDVIKDNGMGSMQIDDDTLPFEKDAVELPVSTCDEVTILPYFLPVGVHNFSVNVSRIAFNKYNPDTGAYDQNESIDPRIVYVDHIKSIASPPYEKSFGIRNTLVGGVVKWIDSPKKASSLEVSFSYLITIYAGLSRLLTKTNLRRAKFNLPVYEVAGLKHYIPIYLNQYKAYFYVNKINNYVPGKLCTIDLIKL